MSIPLAELAEVVHGDGEYSSKLISRVDRKPGELFAKIEGSTNVPDRSYTTVQVSELQDIELNSDLVFMNHSCDPNVVLDVEKLEVRVGDRPVKRGDDLTFFYPSTEWHMQQPFECNCGTKKCLGYVGGASQLPDETLKQYWLNEHIKRLLKNQAVRKDSGWERA